MTFKTVYFARFDMSLPPWHGRLGLRPACEFKGELEFMIVDVHVQDGAPTRVDLLKDGGAARYQTAPYVAPERAEGDCVLVLYGVSLNGSSVSLEVSGWAPWLRLEVPDSWTAADTEALRANLAGVARVPMASIMVESSRLKRLCGWLPEPTDPTHTRRFAYLKISVPKLSALRALQRAMKDGAIKPPDALRSERWTLVDTQQQPRCAALNDLGLSPSGWVRARAQLRLACDDQASHCQAEFTCEATELAPLERDTIPPLVLASFDCEMFSHDGTFPTVGKGDFTYCVCTSFRTYGSSAIKRVAIFVGSDLQVPPESDLLVQCVPTPADVLPAWRNLMVHADPDVVLSWNGKGFDFPFLAHEHAQARLSGLERGTEGVHAVLVRRAHELLGSWSDSVPLPLLCAQAPRVPREALLSAVRVIDKGFDPQRPTIVRALLTSGGGATAAGARQTRLEDFCESDDEEAVEMVAGEAAPTWVGALLKQGPLLESTARKARGALASAAKTPEAAKPASLAKLLPELRKRGLEEALWTWARAALGAGVADFLQRPAWDSSVNLGMMLSRAATETCVLQERQMTTAAKGDNLFSTIPMRGRAVVDLMQIVKDDKKPDSNALSFAAKKWLGGAEHDKIDMPVADIFALYAKSVSDAAAAWPVVDYCARDADIPLWLCDKLMYLPTWVEQSRVCYTALDAVCNGGQQVKVFNLIARFVQGEFAINPPDSGWPVEDDAEDLGEEPSLDRLRKKPSDYVGATVIPPITGFYTDPISTLDFASLYPSIMINFNLCPSTLFRGSQKQLDALKAAHPSITYDAHVIKHNLPDPARRGEYREEERTYLFLTHVPSLLSRLLLHLLNTRKAVKKLLAAATDPALKAVLKGRELGLKLCANSSYGFMGVSAKRGMLPCKPVAAVTTLKGRDMIEATRAHVEAHFAPAKVVYGDTDSVMIHWGPGTTLHEAHELGVRAAEAVTARMRSGEMEGLGGAGALVHASGSQRNAAAAAAVVKLEPEKVYLPYLLLAKKNYAAIKHTPSGKLAADGSIVFDEELDVKGIDAVRRDRSQLLRTMSTDILNALLRERSVDRALGILRARLEDIGERRVPNESFVLSKQLKSHYANAAVHAEAWRRMRERGDAGLPAIGSRMPFLITAGRADSKLHERAEHPAHVASAGLALDYGYYILSLKNATLKLLQFSSTDVASIFKVALERAHLRQLGIGSLTSFFGASASSAEGGAWRSGAKQRIEPRRAPAAKKARKEAEPVPKSSTLLAYFQ